MSELTAGTNSQTKNAALIEAVNEMSKDLLSDPSLDIRIGMANFTIIVQLSITMSKSVRTSFH